MWHMMHDAGYRLYCPRLEHAMIIIVCCVVNWSGSHDKKIPQFLQAAACSGQTTGRLYTAMLAQWFLSKQTVTGHDDGACLMIRKPNWERVCVEVDHSAPTAYSFWDEVWCAPCLILQRQRMLVQFAGPGWFRIYEWPPLPCLPSLVSPPSLRPLSHLPAFVSVKHMRVSNLEIHSSVAAYR